MSASSDGSPAGAGTPEATLPDARAAAEIAARRRVRVARRWMRPSRELVILVLLALAIRVLAWGLRPAILPDAAGLLGAAEETARDGLGALLRTTHHPLPVLLLSWVPDGADAETWGSLAAAVLGALAVVPLHILARCCGGRHAATATGLLYAVLPKFVSVTSVPMAEALFLPLFCGAAALGVSGAAARTRGRRRLRAALAGALAGLAYLARPEGLVVGALAVVATLLRSRRGDRAASTLLAAAAFAAVSLAWVVPLSLDRGAPALSPKKDVAQFAGVDDAPKDPRDGAGAAAARGVRDVADAMWDALGPATVLVAIGAYPRRRWKRGRSRRTRAVLLGGAVVLCAILVRLASGWGYAGGRHALAAALLLLPFAGEGLYVLVGFLSRAVRRRRAALVLTMLFAVPLGVWAVLRPDGETGERERVLGEAIATAEAGREGDVVIGSFREPLVAYYADRALRGTGRRARNLRLYRQHGDLLAVSADLEGSRAEFVERLRTDGARWLVLQMWTRVSDAGGARRPGEDLAQRLLEDGAIRTPVLGSSELAAFPVAE